ncbi:hypothetical protein BUALT_Bualt01G0083000 [Buddleja alternifolia]|uniref:Uncharacterized protein n=1 Tax=Buddleja alternifolia TaxID=168488 RepID=A0AAV6Y6E7_9LAMI|nr:hypothetical protein BUALT_Bualt01G0083000 [Buddleja alternifolia]
MENPNGTTSYCEKMDGLARWLGTSVAAAFFASLDRCSCVNLDTDDQDADEANDRPLMFTSFRSTTSAASSSSFSAAAANHRTVNVNNPPPAAAVENLPV